MNAREANEMNIDAAQREIKRREAEGEDMSGYCIDAQTYEIVRREPIVVFPLRPGAFAAWDNPCPRRGF